ncbi:hypothetical protein BOTCAL_0905g00020 [Botryotinia calthae]|uniref:Uncharacterized protein n=1 Tax=Botryotinia calthae TaxID=38488 RepID=A0A4Y8CHN9_9HELO|nr:hypothetical protein BOTCAL_0905g00020 [Botryotinia calthae]
MLSQIINSKDDEFCISILKVVSIVYRSITLNELIIFIDILDGVVDNYEALVEIINLYNSFLTLREYTIFFIYIKESSRNHYKLYLVHFDITSIT